MSDARVTFELNPGFERQVLTGQGVYTLLNTLGQRVEAGARRGAPKRKGFLEESIVAQVGPDNGGLGGPRLICRVAAKDFKAHWYEFGTRRQDARPYLVPALQAAIPGAIIRGGPGA